MKTSFFRQLAALRLGLGLALAAPLFLSCENASSELSDGTFGLRMGAVSETEGTIVVGVVDYPFIVKVYDTKGNPAEGMTVLFSVVEGADKGTIVQNPRVTTGANGLAQALISAPRDADVKVKIRATLVEAAGSIDIVLTSVSGEPPYLAKIDWAFAPLDTYPAGYKTGTTMTFRAQLRDQYGKPFVKGSWSQSEREQGIQVKASLQSGNPVLLSQDGSVPASGTITVAADDNGVATFEGIRYAKAQPIQIQASIDGRNAVPATKDIVIKAGPAQRYVVVLPGQLLNQGIIPPATLDDSQPLPLSVVSGVPEIQRAGTSFPAEIRAVDETFNIATIYEEQTQLRAYKSENAGSSWVLFSNNALPGSTQIATPSFAFGQGRASLQVTPRWTTGIQQLRLVVSDSSITKSFPSSTFQTIYGNPCRLAITQVPNAPVAGIKAGVHFGQMDVEVQDCFGNHVDDAALPIQVRAYSESTCSSEVTDATWLRSETATDTYAVPRQDSAAGDTSFTNLIYRKATSPGIFLRATATTGTGTIVSVTDNDLGLQGCLGPYKITAGDASKLSFDNANFPTSRVAGASTAWAPPVKVLVTDKFENPVSGSAYGVKLSAYTQPLCPVGSELPINSPNGSFKSLLGNGDTAATPAQPAVTLSGGSAPFNDLVINTAGTAIFFKAEVLGATGIDPGCSQLSVAVASSVPGDIVLVNGNLSPRTTSADQNLTSSSAPLKLAISDVYGNPVTDQSYDITLYPKAQVGTTCGGALDDSAGFFPASDRRRATIVGVATFDSLYYRKAGDLYLEARVDIPSQAPLVKCLANVDTANFARHYPLTITPGPAKRIGFSTTPASTVTVDASLGISAAVYDDWDNLVALPASPANNTLNLKVFSDASCSNDVTASNTPGATSVTPVAAIQNASSSRAANLPASFDLSGARWRTSGAFYLSPRSATYPTFNTTSTAACTLVTFSAKPASVLDLKTPFFTGGAYKADKLFSQDGRTAPVVRVLDEFGNPSSSANSVQLSVHTDTTCSSAAVTGNIPNTASSIVAGLSAPVTSSQATFGSLEIRTVGTYYVKAALSGVTSQPCFGGDVNGATTAGIVVTYGGLDHLAFSYTPPASIVAGDPTFGTPVVRMEDKWTNLVQNSAAVPVLTVDRVADPVPTCSTQTGRCALSYTPGAPTAGTVTYTGLSYQDVSTIRLKAETTIASVTYSAYSANIPIVPAGASKLSYLANTFLDNASDAARTIKAGTVFAPKIQLQVEDAYGNIVNNEGSARQVHLFAYDAGASTDCSAGLIDVAATDYSDGEIENTSAGTGIVEFTAYKYKYVLPSGNRILLKAVAESGSTISSACTPSNRSVLVYPDIPSQIEWVDAPINQTWKTGQNVTGAGAVPLKIRLKDQFGNLAVPASGTHAVAASLFHGTCSGSETTPAERTANLIASGSSGASSSSAVASSDGYATFNTFTYTKLHYTGGDEWTGTIESMAYAFKVTPPSGSQTTICMSTGGSYSLTSNDANYLAFKTQPGGASNVAGTTPLGVQPIVTVRDQYGNRVKQAGISVDLGLFGQASCGGAEVTKAPDTSTDALANDSMSTDAGGLAAFTNLQAFYAGTALSLKAVTSTPGLTNSAPGSVNCSTPAFVVKGGTATQLQLAAASDYRGPANVRADQTFEQGTGGSTNLKPRVRVLDGYGNPATSAAYTIELLPYGGAVPDISCSGSVYGVAGDLSNPTAISSTTDGYALFNNFGFRKAGNLTLKARIQTATSVNVCMGATTVVSHGPPSLFKFSDTLFGAASATEPPATLTARTFFTTQPAVEIRDAYGNPATNVTGNVVLSVFDTPSAGSACTGSSLTSGQIKNGDTYQTTEALVSGTKTFSGTYWSRTGYIRLRAAPSGNIVFASTNYTPTNACSTNRLQILNNSGVRLVFATGTPTLPGAGLAANVSFNATVGATAPKVQVVDADNNIVVNDNATSITVELADSCDINDVNTPAATTLALNGANVFTDSSNSSNLAVFTGTVTAGERTFGNMAIKKAGSFMLRAKAAGITYHACSNAILVTPGAPDTSQITLTQYPTSPLNVDADNYGANYPKFRVKDSFQNPIAGLGAQLKAFSLSTCAAGAEIPQVASSFTNYVNAMATTDASGDAKFDTYRFNKAPQDFYLQLYFPTAVGSTKCFSTDLFTTAPGAPANMIYEAGYQPNNGGATITAGTAFSSPVKTRMRDKRFNNLTAAPAHTVALTLHSQSSCSDGSLISTTRHADIMGGSSPAVQGTSSSSSDATGIADFVAPKINYSTTEGSSVLWVRAASLLNPSIFACSDPISIAAGSTVNKIALFSGNNPDGRDPLRTIASPGITFGSVSVNSFPALYALGFDSNGNFNVNVAADWEIKGNVVRSPNPTDFANESNITTHANLCTAVTGCNTGTNIVPNKASIAIDPNIAKTIPGMASGEYTIKISRSGVATDANFHYVANFRVSFEVPDKLKVEVVDTACDTGQPVSPTNCHVMTPGTHIVAGTPLNFKLTGIKNNGDLVPSYAGPKNVTFLTSHGQAGDWCGRWNPLNKVEGVNFVSGVAYTTSLPADIFFTNHEVRATVNGEGYTGTTGLQVIDPAPFACIILKDNDNPIGDWRNYADLTQPDRSFKLTATAIDKYANAISDITPTWTFRPWDGASGDTYLRYHNSHWDSFFWQTNLGGQTRYVNDLLSSTTTRSHQSAEIYVTNNQLSVGGMCATHTISSTTVTSCAYSSPSTSVPVSLWSSSTADYDGSSYVASESIKAMSQYITGSDSSESWRFDNAKAWYNETFVAQKRGRRLEFPPRALLLGTDASLDVVDLTLNRLWMRLPVGAADILDSNLGSISSIAAANGRIYVGFASEEGTKGGLVILDLKADQAFKLTTAGVYTWSGDLTTRFSGSWGALSTSPVTSGSGPIYSRLPTTFAHSEVLSLHAHASAGLLGLGLRGGVAAFRLEDGNGTGNVDSFAANAVTALKLAAAPSGYRLYAGTTGTGVQRFALTNASGSVNLNSSGRVRYGLVSDATGARRIAALNIRAIDVKVGASALGGSENMLAVSTDRGVSIVNEASTLASSTADSLTYQGTGYLSSAGATYAVNHIAQLRGSNQDSILVNDSANRAFASQGSLSFVFRPDSGLSAATMPASDDDSIVLLYKGPGGGANPYLSNALRAPGAITVRFDRGTGRLVISFGRGATVVPLEVSSVLKSNWTGGRSYHFAAAWKQSGGNLGASMWIDGQLQTDSNQTPVWSYPINSWSESLNPVRLGARTGATGTTIGHFSGAIDDFQMSAAAQLNSNWPASMDQDLASTAWVAPDTSAVYAYRFDTEASAASIANLVASGTSATLINNATLARPLFFGVSADVREAAIVDDTGLGVKPALSSALNLSLATASPFGGGAFTELKDIHTLGSITRVGTASPVPGLSIVTGLTVFNTFSLTDYDVGIAIDGEGFKFYRR